MTVKYIIILWFVGMLTGEASAQRKKAEKDMVLFTIEQEAVPVHEFMYLYTKNHQPQSSKDEKESVLEYLDLFIKFKLKVREAKSRGMDTTVAFLEEFSGYRDELLKPYLPEENLLDSLVKMTYERMSQEVRASHILIKLPPSPTAEDTLQAYQQIEQIRKKAIAGDDFGELASTYTYDQEKATKGDLGYFTALQMVFPFENAAYTTPVGKVSKVFRTRFGYHILKVMDKRPTRGEIEVSHIMIRSAGSAEEENKQRILDVYNQLMAGASWEEMCRTYSEDQNSKEKGGRLRPFGVGAMRQFPEFSEAAFALTNPGDISDPIKTTAGWHIIKLERKISMPSYEELKPQLRQRVAQDDRLQISKEEWRKNYKEKYEFREDTAIRSKVFMLADSTFLTGTWKAPHYPKGNQEILFRFKRTNYFVNDFLSYAQKKQRKDLEPESALQHLYEDYVSEMLLAQVQRSATEENPEFGLLTNEYYEGILLFEIMEDEVWNKAASDSVGQRHFFEEHRKDYWAGERAVGVVYYHKDLAIIESLRKLIERRDSTKIQAFLVEKGVKYDSGRFEKKEKPLFGEISWSPGIYSVQNNGMYYLAEILDIISPGPKTFQEARASVISDYQEALELKWISELRKKYTVKVNEKAKKYVLKKLVGRS